jgi:hypothetical protein
MAIAGRKSLDAIDEGMRVAAQEIFEWSGRDVGQDLVCAGTPYELLDDRPGGFWIVPDQIVEPIFGWRNISRLAAQGNGLGVIEIGRDQVFVFIHWNCSPPTGACQTCGRGLR